MGSIVSFLAAAKGKKLRAPQKKALTPTPNIPLDRLKAVSKEAASYYEHIDEGPVPDRLINVDREDFDTIAADLLRLAEENRRLKVKISKYQKTVRLIHYNGCEP